MAKKSDVIRPHDWIEVVNPQRFVRCGYDLTPENSAQKLLDEHAHDIGSFLKQIGLGDKRELLVEQFTWINSRVPPRQAYDPPRYHIDTRKPAGRQFLKALGFLYAASHGLGDGNRKIFTQPEPLWEPGTKMLVLETQQVMTGTYFAPMGGQDYYGEYWNEPGGLLDQKSHRILTVHFTPTAQQRYLMDEGVTHTFPELKDEKIFKICATDVRKLTDEEHETSGIDDRRSKPVADFIKRGHR